MQFGKFVFFFFLKLALFPPEKLSHLRACYASVSALKTQGCRLAPSDRSKIKVSRSLIGRVGAVAAMEKIKVPPVPEEFPRGGRTMTLSSDGKGAFSGGRHAAMLTKKRVSAYLSSKVCAGGGITAEIRSYPIFIPEGSWWE